MASTGKSKPQLLAVPQIAQIHLNDPATGKAVQTIVEYVNKNLPAAPGTRVAPRPKTPGGNP